MITVYKTRLQYVFKVKFHKQKAYLVCPCEACVCGCARAAVVGCIGGAGCVRPYELMYRHHVLLEYVHEWYSYGKFSNVIVSKDVNFV